MKMKNWIWAGCMALLLGSLAFVACENKSNGGGGGGGSSEGSGAAGSIVGTWKSVVGTTAYYEQSYTITFNADKSGVLQYVEDEPDEVDVTNFTYTFDASTNIGQLKPVGAPEEAIWNFKVVWISKNKIEVYVGGNYNSGDYDYEGYDYEGYDGYEYDGQSGWGLLAVFERQGSSGSGDGDEGTPGEGGGDSGSGGQTYSIVGSWRYAPTSDMYLELTFNSDGSCVYKYVDVYYDQASIAYGTYTYDSSTCKGKMMLTDSENSQNQGTLNFRLNWKSNNSVEVYSWEDGYEQEYMVGTFTRVK